MVQASPPGVLKEDNKNSDDWNTPKKSGRGQRLPGHNGNFRARTSSVEQERCIAEMHARTEKRLSAVQQVQNIDCIRCRSAANCLLVD